ncbi:MAG: hypothetical protein JSR64_00160 [Nitrospira sp.]|nr:hypothetical protein [Nitrospira sp.]MBX3337201.1 hypothetical protein [Nitrospira sp.]MCW5780211.1 hypothetical protein [Nitrospira sp.]
MITFSTDSIPGLRQIRHSDGTIVWELTIHFRGARQTRRYTTLQGAIDVYREEKLRQAFIHWQPLSSAEHHAFSQLLNRHPSLRSALTPLLKAASAAHGSPQALPHPKKPPANQRGLPANQSQKGIGGPIDPDILFHDYARRWFQANQSTWAPSTQDIVRSVCTTHLNPVFGTTLVRNISSQMIEDWLREQLKKYSLALCQNMRKPLASIFYAAIADGLITANPATDPRCMLPTRATRQRLRTSQ